jgi:outer membrane protein insertion porin family
VLSLEAGLQTDLLVIGATGHSAVNSRAVRASVGGSLIWDSPFGALRVDYAYPVAKQSYNVTQWLNFTAGAF